MSELIRQWDEVLLRDNLGPIKTFGMIDGIVCVELLEADADFIDEEAPDPFNEVANSMLPVEVERCLSAVSEQQRLILRLRHGIDGLGIHSKNETSKILEMPAGKVSRLEAYAYHILERRDKDTGHTTRDLLS